MMSNARWEAYLQRRAGQYKRQGRLVSRGCSARLARVSALVFVLLAACTPVRREVQGDLVRRIRFEGNAGVFSGQNGYQLRQAMDQQASPPLTFTWPFMYFSEPSVLSVSTLRADARRLEVYYAHHGWFDAVVSGWEIRRVRARSDFRAGVVDLIGHIEPGPLTHVTKIHFKTPQDMDLAARLVVGAARRSVVIAPGDAFDLETIHEAETAFTEQLQNNGYAYVGAHAETVVDPSKQRAEITFHIAPGPSASFGEITIGGLERLGKSDVLELLDIKAGESYSLHRLRDAQRAVFETGMFSVVNIAPDLSDPSALSVPIKVELTESRFRKVRIGAGVLFNYYTLQPRLTVSFDDLRLGGSELQLRADAAAGAVVGVVSDNTGRAVPVLPTGEVGLALSDPWILKSKLALELGGRFTQDAQFGTLPYRNVQGQLSFLYHFTRDITLSVGPTAQTFTYLQPNESTLTAARLQFGGDFTGSTYRLLSVDANFTVDWRDDPLATRRGSYWNLALRQSIPIPIPLLDGKKEKGFLYSKIEAEMRLYHPFRLTKKQRGLPFVVAGRLHGTLLAPWKSGAKLPYPDLAFLGGPTNLRGFRTNQVGPYDCACSYRDMRPNPQHNNGLPYNVTRTYLPRGGSFALDGELELRYDWRFGLSLAVFGEVGLLSRRLNQIGLQDLRYGGGIGVRYQSQVGPIRLDIGIRPLFPEDYGAASYINCNPIDRLARGFDLFSASKPARLALPDRQIPLAINIMFAIGEAF